MTTTWTQADLQEDSRTLLYEFETLCQIAHNLTSPVASGRISKNAHIESFAIHSRALLCFFFGHDPESRFRCRDTDVLATRLLVTPELWKAKWNQYPVAEHAKQQADRHVAHITTHRRGVNQPGGQESNWPISEIVGMFVKLMEDFLKTVSTLNLAPGVEEELRRLISGSRPKKIPQVLPQPISSMERPVSHASDQSVVTEVRTIGSMLTAKSCPPDAPQ